MQQSRWATPLSILLIALLYVAVARFSLLFVVQPEGLTAFWLPSGFMLAILLLNKQRAWPVILLAVFVANIIANMLVGNTVAISASFALANSVESLVAAWLLVKILGSSITLTSLREVIGFTLLAALFSNACTALLGAAVPTLGFGAPFWDVWRVWWIADGIGMLLLVPLILAWSTAHPGDLKALIVSRGAEILIVFGSMAALAQVVFSARAETSTFFVSLPYVTFPFLLWAAVRLGLRGVSVAALVLALIAVWHTAHAAGPFVVAGTTAAERVEAVQAFLGVAILSSLMLTAVIAERQRAQHDLHRAYDALEQRVQERTSDLSTANRALQAEITERQRAEDQLRRTAAELARSNAELEQFAYVASHDLQEPLRAVAGCVQILQRRYQSSLDARADELIAHTVAGATRMQTLINDLLAYARVNTRGEPFVPTECSAVLTGVLANLDVAITESGARITYGALPTVLGDATQLARVFQNLISNAIRFCDADAPAIHISVERAEGEWVFAVRDNGIGIEPQYFERIFQIFQRLHTRAEYPGTGIGLAICKKIVERHGGRIWVESAAGEGATFAFTVADTRM